MSNTLTSHTTEPRIDQYFARGSAYQIGDELTALVRSVVEGCWLHRDSLDETVDACAVSASQAPAQRA